MFSYYLGKDSSESVTVRVLDAKGTALFTTRGSTEAGLHRVSWGGGGGRGRGGRGARGGGGFAGIARRLGGGVGGPGTYVVEVTRGDQAVRKVFKITGPATPAGGRRRGGEAESRRTVK